MMFWEGGPSAALWPIATLAFVVGVILVIVWAVQRGSYRSDDALTILRGRFARGEIDQAVFDAQREALERSAPGPRRSGNWLAWLGLLLIIGALVGWFIAAALYQPPQMRFPWPW